MDEESLFKDEEILMHPSSILTNDKRNVARDATELQKLLIDERMRCESHKTNYQLLKEQHNKLILYSIFYVLNYFKHLYKKLYICFFNFTFFYYLPKFSYLKKLKNCFFLIFINSLLQNFLNLSRNIS